MSHEVPANPDCVAEKAEAPVLVSACLLGRHCTYKGGHNRDAVLEAQLAENGERPVPFCPEEAGGLATPRPAANLTASAADVLDGDGAVVDVHGVDVTAEFVAGAQSAAEVCARYGIRRAYLKERSPSCGCVSTHVDGIVTEGPGLTAELLRRCGVDTVGVEGRRR